MAQNFIDCDREQAFLLPPSLRDWLPEDHLAWFVIDAVGRLDLEAFYAAYRADGHGRAAYEPSMVGWIQPVVATLNDEELRCPGEALRWIAPLRQGRGMEDTHRLGAGSIASGSGRRLPGERRASMLLPRRACCRRLVSGGSGRLAECRLSPSRRCPGAICRLLSGRR